MHTVMGVNTWPEPDEADFKIIDVAEGESFVDAIMRARSHYSPSLECYVIDERGNRCETP